MSAFGGSPSWQSSLPAVPGVDRSWWLDASHWSAASVSGSGSWVGSLSCACCGGACPGAQVPPALAPWACMWSDPFSWPTWRAPSGFRVVALAAGVSGLRPRSFFSVLSAAPSLPGSFALLRRRVVRAGFPVPAGPWVFSVPRAGSAPLALRSAGRSVQSSVPGSAPWVSFWVVRPSGGVWPVPASWFGQPFNACRRCGDFGGVTRPCGRCRLSITPAGLVAMAAPFASPLGI